LLLDDSRIVESANERDLVRRFEREEFLPLFDMCRGVEVSQSGEITLAVLLRVDILEHQVDKSAIERHAVVMTGQYLSEPTQRYAPRTRLRRFLLELRAERRRCADDSRHTNRAQIVIVDLRGFQRAHAGERALLFHEVVL
jgi:hypothetical protein